MAVEPIDGEEPRRKHEILGLGGEDARHRAATAKPLEDGAEDGSVREVKREPGRTPEAPARDRGAEEADVRVGRPEEPT